MAADKSGAFGSGKTPRDAIRRTLAKLLQEPEMQKEAESVVEKTLRFAYGDKVENLPEVKFKTACKLIAGPFLEGMTIAVDMMLSGQLDFQLMEVERGGDDEAIAKSDG
jgi:hypothetical protein